MSPECLPRFAARTQTAARNSNAITPMQAFTQRLNLSGNGLRRRRIDILQVNMGLYCNQACIHCHVEAGPTRREMMSQETVDAVLHFLERANIPTLDITGGAPELNANFDYLVKAAVALKRHVMDRCNLTVIFERGKEYLPEFFKHHEVELVCSLPCYTEANVDTQRGKGTFDLSIRALKIFNDLGYGQRGSGLTLNLVYNPVGPHLPPPQQKLEQDYKRILTERFGIEFNHLYCLTNMPITRYETHLKLRGEYQRYMELLETSFNPVTVEQVMCRTLISVGWEGTIYDCDFNQMLDLPIRDDEGKALSVFALASVDQLLRQPIAVGNHCYACTAGCGSSCGGALISESSS
jgi:radical SAM/Cys-rich protein